MKQSLASQLFFCQGNVQDYRGRIITKKGEPFPEELMNGLMAENNGYVLLNEAQQVGGIQIPIDTLTQIYPKVTTQVRYSIPISDFVPVDTGIGAFSQSLLTYQVGGKFTNFKQSIMKAGKNSITPQVEMEVQAIQLPIVNFKQALTYDLFDLGQIALTQVVDLIEQKEFYRKEQYDIGLQDAAFVGIPEYGEG